MIKSVRAVTAKAFRSSPLNSHCLLPLLVLKQFYRRLHPLKQFHFRKFLLHRGLLNVLTALRIYSPTHRNVVIVASGWAHSRLNPSQSLGNLLIAR